MNQIHLNQQNTHYRIPLCRTNGTSKHNHKDFCLKNDLGNLLYDAMPHIEYCFLLLEWYARRIGDKFDRINFLQMCQIFCIEYQERETTICVDEMQKEKIQIGNNLLVNVEIKKHVFFASFEHTAIDKRKKSH